MLENLKLFDVYTVVQTYTYSRDLADKSGLVSNINGLALYSENKDKKKKAKQGYTQGMTPIAKIVIAISIKFEIAIAISKKIADRDRDQFTYC